MTGLERLLTYESTHKCTDDDKEKFFVNPSYEGDFFRDERLAATFKDFQCIDDLSRFNFSGIVGS